MAKQSQQTRDALDSERRRQTAISDDEMAHQRQLRNEAQSRANDTYGRVYDSYSNFMGGGLTPEEQARLRGEFPGSGHSGGGPSFESFSRDWSRYQPIEDRYRNALAGKTVDTDRLRAGFGTFDNMQKTGGFSNEQLASMGQSLGYLKGMGLNGGLDDNSIHRMRGGGVFDEFADTGGYSDRDKFLIRDRTTSQIPAFYADQKREIERLGRVSGNGGPAGARSALMSRMGRDSSREMSRASRDAELEIMDRVNQGRQWGSSSMSTAENSLQSLRTQNMLQSLAAALQFEQGMGQTLANNKLAGADAISRYEMPIQQLLVDEGRWGADNLKAFLGEQDAEAAAAVNARNAAAASAWENSLANEWDIINFQNRNRMYGTEGMHGLYDSNVDQTMGYTDSLNRHRNSDALILENLNTRGQIKGPDWGKYMAMAAGIGGAALTGGASLGVMGAIGGGLSAAGGMGASGGFGGGGYRPPANVNMNGYVAPSPGQGQTIHTPFIPGTRFSTRM